MADYDRRELTNDKGVLFRAALQGLQSTMWTALPGMVISYDAIKMTCQVKPTIKAKVLDAKGITTDVELPLLVDCPVIFPSGGGFTLTFPIKPGDECLVIFSSRCIDSWWQSGGIQVQAELRMHDLSDGFILPGPKSLPNVLPGISATDVQLRNHDGTNFVGIKPTGEIDVVAPLINLQGNVVITGNLAVDGVAGGMVTGSALMVNDLATPLLPSYKLHNHGGVSTGSGYTSIPFPGS